MDTDKTLRRRSRRLAVSVAALAGAAGVGAGVVALTQHGDDGAGSQPAAISSSEPAALTDASESTIGQIYDRVAAGVVELSVSGTSSTPFGDQQAQAEGSGFVIDEEGHIVTNAHVVDGAETITVTFSDGTEVPAELVGQDASTDLAVVKVDVPASRLGPLTLGSSADVRIGDPVVAIGSPFGLEGTVTSGIVSALDRTIDAPNGFTISGAIQTDAAINHGNSGGPLLDAAGKVIGVTAQIASESGGNDGVGFAIPSDTVRQVAEQLVAGKTVEHAYLGVSLATVDAAAAQALDLPRGVQIVSVQPGSPAAEAGLRAGSATTDVNGQAYSTDGDVVTAIDGTRVSSADELSAEIAGRHPGDRVSLSVYRDGATTSVEVTLGTRPS
jgi:S1-C subfamily serine protease